MKPQTKYRLFSKPSKALVSICGLVVAIFACCLFAAPAFGQSSGSESNLEGLELPSNPQSASSGLQGVVPTPPPDRAPSIATPSNGASFGKMPITINGLCQSDLLVKLFANGVFIGSAICQNGSYSLQADLFSGQNELVARQYDDLDQPSPDSNTVSSTYNNSQFLEFGQQLLSLTSVYARRGANPGDTLSWPITINGGRAPYALSIDWGDGQPSSLSSVEFVGNTTISHVYEVAGTYTITVRATDKDGQTAFLQLVGQANGAVAGSGELPESAQGLAASQNSSIWGPAAVTIPLSFAAFWLGRRFEVTSLRRRLSKD